MNVSRLVASIGGYFLSTGEDGVAFHLYGGVEANVDIGGTKVALRETSDYPWSGDIRIEVDPEAPAAFDLKLRVPGWAKGAKATVNGEPMPLAIESGYATIHRPWSKGDVVTLALPMPAERLYAHPNVRMDVGRVALRRGPLIYCVEEADNPGQPVQTLELPRAAPIEAKWRDGPVRRRDDARSAGEAPRPRRRGRRALFDVAAGDPRRHADRNPLLSLGQSRARLDAGVDRRRRLMKVIGNRARRQEAVRRGLRGGALLMPIAYCLLPTITR